MKHWSDNPIHPNFQLKFFVDTNILAYLVDNTYPSLTTFIEQARDCSFVKLVSSKYVIFEFVGIRKKEHYLRKVALKSTILGSQEINFSSLLRYQNKYEAPEAIFEDVIDDIKQSVNKELELISTKYEIDYDYSILHQDQLGITFDICLSSKIANQDSMVLVSSILPQPKTQEENIQLLTNDTDFVNSFNRATNLDAIFAATNLKKPLVHPIYHVVGKIGGRNMNLLESNEPAQITQLLIDKIFRLLANMNSEFYLGETFTPRLGFPNDIICFKAKLGIPFRSNVYLTIISKDLDFIYTSKTMIANIWHNSAALPDNYIFEDPDANNVSFKLLTKDDDGNLIPLDNEILQSLKLEGNLIFVHPDS